MPSCVCNNSTSASNVISATIRHVRHEDAAIRSRRPSSNRGFCDGKKIPMKLRFLRKLCTNREFPCVWSGKGWHTTEGAIRAYFWQKANREFKKLTS